MKFVYIKNNVAFRKIFGNKNKKQVLISFLIAVLCLNNNIIISNVTVLPPYQLLESRERNVTIADVETKDNYENLMPTFFIGILDFVVTKNKNFINQHIVKDTDTASILLKILNLTS